MLNEQGLHKLFNLEIQEDAPVVIIYSPQISVRLNYVCRFIFNHVMNVHYVLTSDRHEFSSTQHIRINYSREIFKETFQVFPFGLLNENSVREEKPPVRKRNGKVHFYPQDENSDLSFDVFSAVFYMISRYEEWQTHVKDKHGRFELDQSILFKHDSHLRPLTDIWIEDLKMALATFYPSLIYPRKQPITISTIDVDNLYAYRSKGFVRTVGASVKDMLRLDFANVVRRVKTISKSENDPFDIYEGFSKFCYGHSIPLFWFFLYRSGTEHDRTVDPLSGAFKKPLLVTKTNGASVGLHPSYETVTDEQLLQEEIKSFSSDLGEKVIFSRQHYLRFDIKTTPAQLYKAGIRADFTMGFASGSGFRAGTCFPFFYYDFHSENENELIFVPFCAMDGAYTVYTKKSARDAEVELKKLKEETRKVNGPFITVFHERTFAEHLFPGYAGMYKKLITEP